MKTEKFDVIVVGGGISGTIAAIAAARCGVATLIVEQYGFLGGMLTAAGVGPMMTFHAGEKQVIQGITGELIERLVAKGKSPGHIFDTTGFTYTVTPFDAEAMKAELETMLLESGGSVLYHTMLAGVSAVNGRINQIQVCNKAGVTELTAGIYIDATGDADLSSWAGVGFTKGRTEDGACQPMTMNMKMRQVDIDKVRRYIKENPDEFPRLKGNTQLIDKANRLSIGGFVKTFKQAKEDGEISFMREDLLFFETNNPGEVIINTSRVLGYDSTDPWSFSQAEIEGRRQVAELEQFLKHRVPGFENAILAFSGPAIGVRSSRQISGVYRLEVDDLLAKVRFDDTIACSGYPVDIHNPTGEGTKSIHLEWGSAYHIPFRCLINEKIKNLITVGRCISASFEAQAAIRLSPSCGAIGHAGGVAAALAARRNISPNEVDIKELQATLVKQQAYLEG